MDVIMQATSRDGSRRYAVIRGLPPAERALMGSKFAGLRESRAEADPLDSVTDPHQRADILRLRRDVEALRRPKDVRALAAAEHRRARERVRAAGVGKRDLACSTVRDAVATGTMPPIEDGDACGG